MLWRLCIILHRGFLLGAKSEVDLHPESQNWSIRQMRITADIRVILKRWLPEQVWRYLHRVVEFDGLFGTERGQTQKYAGRAKRIADFAIDKGERQAVLVAVRDQTVIAESRGELGVLAVQLSGTPVVSCQQIQSAIRPGVWAIHGLIGPKINQIVSARFNPLRIVEFACVIRGTEFVVARVGFARSCARRAR